METIDWVDILDSFEADSCVLFLGPYAFQNEQNQSIEQALFDYLELAKIEEDKHERIKRYYKDDGLFLFKTLSKKNKIMKDLKDFYDAEYQPQADFLDKIAQLPFSLIVNLSPDEFIQKTFEKSEIQLPYFQDFYDKDGEIPETYFDFKSEKPLLYNLLGSVRKYESLILTHDDLFGYLESFFAANKMHNNLKSYIQNAQTFIFLGLPIDKWYTQLLLRILKLNKPMVQKEELKRLSSFNDNGDTMIFTDQFYFNMTQKTHIEFINKLYETCAEEKLLKAKQTADKKPVLDLDEIKKIVGEAKLAEAIDTLEKVLKYYKPKSNKLLNTLTLIKSSLKDLEIRDNKGIEANYKTSKNTITQNFLDFLSDSVEVQINDIMI